MVTRKVVFLCALLAGLSISKVFGQITVPDVQEIWPSFETYYKINDRFRLYGNISQTSLDSTSYADGALGLFLDVFAYPLFSKRRVSHLEELPGKYLRLRVGYQYSGTPAGAEDPFSQSLIVTQLDGRLILPYAFLFTLRNRFDYRFKNDDFSMRYRPRLTLQRDFRTEFLFFTISNFVEYYANFGDSELNRFRYQLGCEFKISRHLSYESFWNHQFANEPNVGSVNAFGMSLKLYLSAKGNKEAKQK